jgi:hypothetical protein
VARYRLTGKLRDFWAHTIEITVHPGQPLTDELVLVLAISADWLSSYSADNSGGRGMTSEHQPEATTIRSWTDRSRAGGLSFIFVFVVGTGLLIDGLDRPGWTKHALVPAVPAYLAARLVVTWRICRMGVRFGTRRQRARIRDVCRYLARAAVEDLMIRV